MMLVRIGPTKEQVAQGGFEMTIFASGYVTCSNGRLAALICVCVCVCACACVCVQLLEHSHGQGCQA